MLFYCFYYVTRGIPASRNLSQGKCPLRPFSVSPVIAPTVSLVYLCPALLNNCPAPPSLTLASGGVPGGGVDESHPQDSIKISEVIRGARCGFSNAQSRLNLLFRASPPLLLIFPRLFPMKTQIRKKPQHTGLVGPDPGQPILICNFATNAQTS